MWARSCPTSSCTLTQIPPGQLCGYRAEGASPVEIDRDTVEQLGVRVHMARLLPDGVDGELRHDPNRLALAVRELGIEAGRVAA
jgi:hypothetical protein